MSSKTPDVLECARLLEFQKFLRELVGDVNAPGAEMRNCMTRNNNETYPVSPKELHAEVTMCIWTHLQSKRCPSYFQLPLLHAALAEVEQECRNAKECNFADINAGNDSVELTEMQFDLVKLQKFVINNLEKLLTRLTDNAEAGNLQNYAEKGTLCEHTKCNCGSQLRTVPPYVVGYIKNKHRKMEDRHLCLERFSDLYQLKRPYGLYSVYDGHSGSSAASYAACQLPHALAECLKECDVSVAAYREAFESAFLLVDTMFTQKRISSGSTAVCALISQQTPAHLYVAWVGDSKALLVSPTVSLQLVKPHKPDSVDERKRIETSDTGGAVMFIQGHWRVNGILNVSRSIGDYSVSAVIAEPDFVDVELTATHDFLVLGTDGLWDHVSEARIVQTVYEALNDVDHKPEDIPKLLIELAKQGDSQDNITVVIVFFKERSKIVANYENK